MLTGETSIRRLVPLAAVFAAVYGTLRLVPFSLWIGGSGRAFTATEFVAPLFGIMLGPYVGSAAAVAGTFLAIVLTGRMNFFGLDFLPVLSNALVLGFLIRRRWLVSVFVYSILLALFFIDPSTLHFVPVTIGSGIVQVPFVWLHIVAWILLASPLGRRSVSWLDGRTTSKATVAACTLALIGTTAQHLTGTILFASLAVPLMGMTPQALGATWNLVFYLYPVERLVVIFAATIVTVATTRALIAGGLTHTRAGTVPP
jgi:hypothetical protein